MRARRAILRFSDDGPGVAPENLDRVFEPFFTTKGEKGTGLGMWITRGILQQQGGEIRISSNTKAGESGTCFDVFIPARRQGAATATNAKSTHQFMTAQGQSAASGAGDEDSRA